MMNPQLFPLLNADSNVRLLMYSTPELRVYPWGRAPINVKKPYAVYTVFNGNPENYLDSAPDIDNKGTQINVYADNADSLEKCYNAIRNVLEKYGHMTNFSTPALDADTDLYSATLEFDFWDER